MVYGVRTCSPLAVGLIIGVLATLLILNYYDTSSTHGQKCSSMLTSDEGWQYLNNVSSTEHWQVVVKKSVPLVKDGRQQTTTKMVRPKFAVTELRIRKKLVVIVLGNSSLSTTLNNSIVNYVPKVHIFIDSQRKVGVAKHGNHRSVDALGTDEYRLTANFILKSLHDMSIAKNYDWLLFLPETTYVNPFELMRYVNSISWNGMVAISGAGDTTNKLHHNCHLDSGILLSNGIVKLLLRRRHLCNSTTSETFFDYPTLEECLYQITNLMCLDHHEGKKYNFWRIKENSDENSFKEIMKDVASGSSDRFLAFSGVRSHFDVVMLHEIALDLELEIINRKIQDLSAEIEELSYNNIDGPSWPAALPPYSKPVNRYQVPKWEYFTNKSIFKDNAILNMDALFGEDKADIAEVTAAARSYAENESGSAFNQKFICLRNGYRLFDAMRGMDYMVDLLYLDGQENIATHRIHLVRPIVHTAVMNEMHSVEENVAITIVIPIASIQDIEAVRYLLGRYLLFCLVSANDRCLHRLVIASRGVGTSALYSTERTLDRIKARCKSSQIDTAILPMHMRSHPTLTVAALDTATKRYGEDMIYLVLSPYAAIRPEFLERVRVNTIKSAQVFFPIPFAYFHPEASRLNEELKQFLRRGKARTGEFWAPSESMSDIVPQLNPNFHINLASYNETLRTSILHKNFGRFDSFDFSIFSIYGSDYAQFRSNLKERALLHDLSSLFLNQTKLHLLRAVEPALQIRYHRRFCGSELPVSEYTVCSNSRRQTIGTRAQLSTILFSTEFFENYSEKT